MIFKNSKLKINGDSKPKASKCLNIKKEIIGYLNDILIIVIKKKLKRKKKLKKNILSSILLNSKKKKVNWSFINLIIFLTTTKTFLMFITLFFIYLLIYLFIFSPVLKNKLKKCR